MEDGILCDEEVQIKSEDEDVEEEDSNTPKFKEDDYHEEALIKQEPEGELTEDDEIFQELDENYEKKIKEKSDLILCKRCNKKIRRDSRRRHLIYHRNPKTCRICGGVYPNLQTYQLHYKQHKNAITKVRSGDKTYKCEVCQKKFFGVYYLNKHSWTHNPQSDPLEWEKPYKCEYCEKRFRFSSNRLSHLKVHTRKYIHKCDKCGKMLASKRSLDGHLRTHTGEEPFKCEKCSKTFKLKHGLAHHISQHDERPQHPCDSCELKYYSPQSLARHRKKRHNC